MRRKVVAAPKAAGLDEKKLAQCVKKLDAQSIPSVDEVVMIKDDGENAIRFVSPKGSFAYRACCVRWSCRSFSLVPSYWAVSVNMRMHPFLHGRPSPAFPPMRSPSSSAVQGNFDSNTYIVSGSSNTCPITDINVNSVNPAQLKAAYEAAARAGAAGTQATVDEEDDEMPELEQDFESASIKK